MWFETPNRFEYHGDPEKTAAAFDDRGWSTLGDIGHLDDDGYLYLTDRVSNMIISGGVNIYPREVEDVLVLHPAVADVAVIGVPHPDMGEAVRAVVQLAGAAAARRRPRRRADRSSAATGSRTSSARPRWCSSTSSPACRAASSPSACFRRTCVELRADNP